MNMIDDNFKNAIRFFLKTYCKEEVENAKNNLNQPYLIEADWFELDQHLQEACPQLCSPDTLTTPQIQDSIQEIVQNEYNSLAEFKIINYPQTIDLQMLNSNNIGKWFTSVGMIKTITDPQPILKEAVYVCKRCGAFPTTQRQSNGTSMPSEKCDCGSQDWKLDIQHSKYELFRLIKFEEPLELRTNGGSSREFICKIRGFLASPQYNLKAGDVCNISGWFQIIQDPKTRQLSFQIEGYDVKPVNSSYDELKLSDDDIDEIINLSRQPDIFEQITNSIAPEVYGYQDVKEGLTLQLFEGDKPKEGMKSTLYDRHVIHILLLGEPGIGKSKLIKSVNQLAPKVIKSNGGGTSQAGITATAVKDELTGSWSLEAGGIVLGDGGLLTIDEFDKLNKKVMESLNEPLEDLSVSVAKAGLVQNMTARTSLLAGCNPKYGKWFEEKSFDEQVMIPNTTLSRFDLIYLLKDEVNAERDRDMAQKVIRNEVSKDKKMLEPEVLKKYVNYAKNNCYPVFTDEAINYISDYYVKVRKLASVLSDGKLITMRELGAICRLAVARAKVELKPEIELVDAKNAILIYENSLKTLDLDIAHTGEISQVLTDTENDCLSMAEDMVKDQFEEYGMKIPSKILEGISMDLSDSFDTIKKDRVKKLVDMSVENVMKKKGIEGY